jgi:hypothetical protein
MCPEESEFERDENKIRLTELFFKASAKCSAPTFPILINARK